MSKSHDMDTTTLLTAPRAARLYKLLCLTENSTRSRGVLLKRLGVDLRSFYRDVEVLRDLGISFQSDGDKYWLDGTLDEALEKLPFPDPGLTFRDVMQLSQGGKSPLQKKLLSRLSAVTKSNS